MRLFAHVAEARSFTAAARALGVPKQTLSRRVGRLEQTLGVQLMQRTTRRLHLTDVGAVYAERCAQLVALAEEANRAAIDAHETPRGILRVTADPVFGEAFLSALLVEYARRWPEVRLDVLLTRRRVDLGEESFDVAFRVGQPNDPSLVAYDLGPARVRYCASPAYVRRRGAPRTPEELAGHDCLVVADQSPVRWPFRGRKGPTLVPVSGRLTTTSFAMAHDAARAGLGIAIFPEFACARDLATRKLVSVLDDWCIEVGAVWLAHPARRALPARVAALIELAKQRFAEQPWVREPRSPRR